MEEGLTSDPIVGTHKEVVMAREITRRGFLQGAAAGAGVLVGLGHLDPSGSSSEAATSPIKRGGIWRVAGWMTPPTLDVHRISQYWVCIGGMYDCLLSTRIDPKTLAVELLPGLATAWQYEKDGKRIIFTLRKGVVFHDGSKFDATVAKWNLDRVRNHPKSLLKADLTEIESVEALNDSTLAINLHYPSCSLLYNLSTARLWAGMVSKAFQEKHGLQCGFCTSGILMTVLPFLETHPEPSEEEIREAIDGNLCRCTGYQNIVDAVKLASEKIAAHK